MWLLRQFPSFRERRFTDAMPRLAVRLKLIYPTGMFENASKPSENWRNGTNWPRDFRKFMAWIFLINSITYLLQSVRFLGIQHFPAPVYRSVLGGPIFSAVVAIVCAVAWWKVWKETRWARSWAIAA